MVWRPANFSDCQFMPADNLVNANGWRRVVFARHPQIPDTNNIVGGFSQGAAISLASSMTLPVKVGGFVALSGFCCAPFEAFQSSSSKNLDTPIFHGHGDDDPVVPLQSGKAAKEFYTSKCGMQNYDFRVYRGLEHSTSPEEIFDLIEFIKNVFSMSRS